MMCSSFTRKLQTKGKLSPIRPSKSVRLKHCSNWSRSISETAQHPPITTCVSKSRPCISLYLGPEAPLAKNQSCAPSLPMLFPSKLMFVRVLLTFNTSARACRQSNGKWEDIQCDLQKHMQRYIVAPWNSIDTSEQAERKAKEKVNMRSRDSRIELQLHESGKQWIFRFSRK